MRNLILVVIVALAGCGTGDGSPAARSPEVDVPAAVTDRITAVLGGRDVRIGRDGDGYEAEATTELELVIGADGTLIETEVELPVAIVPALIRAAVTEAIVEAALIVTADGVVYELETAGREVRVDPTGQILGEEREDDDDDDEDDDD